MSEAPRRFRSYAFRADAGLYAAAIALLTEAMSLAQQSDATTVLNMARAGRARANLMAGNLDAAMADAKAIPDGFVYYAKFSEQGNTNDLVTLNHYTENKAAGLDSRRWSQVRGPAGRQRRPKRAERFLGWHSSSLISGDEVAFPTTPTSTE